MRNNNELKEYTFFLDLAFTIHNIQYNAQIPWSTSNAEGESISLDFISFISVVAFIMLLLWILLLCKFAF